MLDMNALRDWRFSIDMQGDDVGLAKHVFKCNLLGITAGQHVGDVAEDDAHAEGFG